MRRWMFRAAVMLILAAGLWADRSQAQQAEFPCAMPTICERIPCYFRTPSVVTELTNEQVFNFAIYYYMWCW